MRRVAVMAAVAVAAFLAATSVKNVGPDEVALLGQGTDLRELAPGINVVRPFRPLARFKLTQTRTWRGNRSVEIDLAGGRKTRIGLDLQVELARDHVRDLYGRYGGDFVEKLVRPLVRLETASALSERGSSKASAEALADEIMSRANARLEDMGVRLSSLTLTTLPAPVRTPAGIERGEGVKVFILGLDAYDWIIMDKVAAAGGLRNMSRLRREGAWGNLESIPPLVSPLIWTTMVTGVTPDIHGITDFLVRDDTTGEEIPITSSSRKVPALWNITSLFGLSSGFIGWFASFPAENVNGFIVSDRFGYHMFDPGWVKGAPPPSSGLTWPPGLYDEIEPLTVEPEKVDADMSRFIRGSIAPYLEPSVRAGDAPDAESSLRQVISAYSTYENVMKKLYPEYKPDLFAIYFEFTDSVCHLFMRYMDPPMEGIGPEEARRYGGAIAETYAEADRVLGDVLDMIDDDTVLIVISDHGFKSGEFRPLSDSRMGFGQAIEWHRIMGSIAMYGGIVKPGWRISDASVLDIAPTVLYLLGLPVDRKMTGKVLTGALSPEWVRDHPVTYTSAYDSLIAPPEASSGPGPGSEALKEKLASLGYVAGGGSALANLASFYHRSGKYAEALDAYGQILEEEPGNVEARIGLGNVYLKTGEEDKGVEVLEGVLRDEPANLDAMQSLANYYVEKGDGAAALRIAERAIAVDGSDGGSYFIKGISLQRLGRQDDAIAALEKALELAPDMPEIYANLAVLYVDAGHAGRALKMADKALELSPGRADMFYVRGRALATAGRTSEAVEQFRKAIALDSSYVPAYLGLAGGFFSEGEFDSVLAVGRKALESPSAYTAYVHDVMGSAYLKLHEPDAAIDEYEAAVAADPKLAGPRLNLARAYVTAGKRDKARRVLGQVLSVEPGNAEAAQMLRSLGSD